MNPHYAEIRSKVCVYERDYLQYTKCLCRGIELVVSGRPEELVRQVLLYFLLRESGLLPDTIAVRTEHYNLGSPAESVEEKSALRGRIAS